MSKIPTTTVEQLEIINQRLEDLRKENKFAKVNFDTETTGFMQKNKVTGLNDNRMHEFGAIITVDGKPLLDENGKDISQIQIYFNPWLEEGSKDLVQGWAAYQVHGIDKGFLEGKKSLGDKGQIYLQEPAKSIEEYLEPLSELLSNNIIVSHNGRTFDIPFFNTELARFELPEISKIGIHLDTQRVFQETLKTIKTKYPDLLENLGWEESAKLSVDDAPNKGVIPFIEKVSGKKNTIERDLHGALLDSLLLEWVENNLHDLEHPETKELLFAEYKTFYEIIISELQKQAKVEEEVQEDFPQEETDTFVKFYSNKTSMFAENPYYQGSVDINNIFKEAQEKGIKEVTIMDFVRPNQNPITRDTAKKYPEVKANYGTTIRLQTTDENGENKYLLVDLVAKNGEEYGELMDIMVVSTRNNHTTPFVTLNDIEGLGLTKSIKYPYFEKETSKAIHSDLYNEEDSLLDNEKITNDLLNTDLKFDIENSNEANKYIENGFSNDRLVKTGNVYFTNKQELKNHELRVKSSMNSNNSLDIPLSDKVKNSYLKTPYEYNREFEGIENTHNIETDFTLPEHRDIMADYFVKPGYDNAFEEFVDSTNKGLEQYLSDSKITDPELVKEYKDRLKSEQEIIKGMIDDSVAAKERGDTFDTIDFDTYLLGMKNKIDSVKSITDILVKKHGHKYTEGSIQPKLIVGTARGSAGGSLAAFCLKITDLDPIPYGLYFERFLNPSRVTPPDIDTDFAGSIDIDELNIPEIEEKWPHLYEFMDSVWKKRYEGKKSEYIEEETEEEIATLTEDGKRILSAKNFISEYYEWYRNTKDGRQEINYNEDKTGGVLTLGYYKAKTALSDMAKIYGDTRAQMLGFADSVQLGNYLSGFVGSSVAEAEQTIEEVLENNPQFSKLYSTNVIIKNIIDDAKKIFGTIKSEGVHAGAVVSEPENIEGVKTTNVILNKSGVPVCPFTMKNVEVMKDDILGLKTLETIEYTLELIRKGEGLSNEEFFELSDKSKHLTRNKFAVQPEELKNMLQVLKEGNNKGLFQIESDGMIDLFSEVFENKQDLDNYLDLAKVISVCLALYRPGPMESGMLSRYLSNVSGETEIEIPFGNKELEELLTETEGVVAYQEQVMKMVQIIGGFSLGEADNIRRAMGKKDIKLMDEYGAVFVEGGKKQGYPEEELTELYENIKKFAGYGFNKSHSAAYGEITLTTLFLKANYPIYFAIARLNNKIGVKSDIFGPILQQVIKEGHTINKPNIFDRENYSIKFDVNTKTEPKSINYGYEFILGLNSATKIEKLIKENPNLNDEEFRNLLFTELDKGAVEKLIKAGDLRIGNETFAEVNEKYYIYKDGLEKIKDYNKKKKKPVEGPKPAMSQFDYVKEFLMKDKVAFAKAFDNAIKKGGTTWRKESFMALLEDQEIKEHLTKLGKYEDFLNVMNTQEDAEGNITQGKVDTVKFFPSTDFEIWLSEIKTICMENTVVHPLSTKQFKEYEKGQKLTHFDDLMTKYENALPEDLQTWNDEKLTTEVIGIGSGISQITSKKGNPMLIGDVVTENGQKMTILVTGDAYENIKLGEDIQNNQIIRVKGQFTWNEKNGLGIFVKESSIVKENDIDPTKEEKVYVAPVVDTPKVKVEQKVEQNDIIDEKYFTVQDSPKNNRQHIVEFKKEYMSDDLKSKLEDMEIKLFGNKIYTWKNKTEDIVEELEEFFVDLEKDNTTQVENNNNSNEETIEEINEVVEEKPFSIQDSPKNNRQHIVEFKKGYMSDDLKSKLEDMQIKLFGNKIYTWKNKTESIIKELEELFNLDNTTQVENNNETIEENVSNEVTNEEIVNNFEPQQVVINGKNKLEFNLPSKIDNFEDLDKEIRAVDTWKNGGAKFRIISKEHAGGTKNTILLDEKYDKRHIKTVQDILNNHFSNKQEEVQSEEAERFLNEEKTELVDIDTEVVEINIDEPIVEEETPMENGVPVVQLTIQTEELPKGNPKTSNKYHVDNLESITIKTDKSSFIWEISENKTLIFKNWPNSDGVEYYESDTSLTPFEIGRIFNGMKTDIEVGTTLKDGKKDKTALLKGNITNFVGDRKELSLDTLIVKSTKGDDLEFTWDEEYKTFICKDIAGPGKHASIELHQDNIYKLILGETKSVISNKSFPSKGGYTTKEGETLDVEEVIVSKQEICPHGKIKSTCEKCNHSQEQGYYQGF